MDLFRCQRKSVPEQHCVIEGCPNALRPSCLGKTPKVVPAVGEVCPKHHTKRKQCLCPADLDPSKVSFVKFPSGSRHRSSFYDLHCWLELARLPPDCELNRDTEQICSLHFDSLHPIPSRNIGLSPQQVNEVLLKHRIIFEPEILLCSICGFVCFGKPTLHSHMNLTHPDQCEEGTEVIEEMSNNSTELAAACDTSSSPGSGSQKQNENVVCELCTVRMVPVKPEPRGQITKQTQL